MERCGDFVGAGEGTDDAHRAGAAEANGDVDAEDAGEQAHPREAMRGRLEQLQLERWLGDGPGTYMIENEDEELEAVDFSYARDVLASEYRLIINAFNAPDVIDYTIEFEIRVP